MAQCEVSYKNHRSNNALKLFLSKKKCSDDFLCIIQIQKQHIFRRVTVEPIRSSRGIEQKAVMGKSN